MGLALSKNGIWSMCKNHNNCYMGFDSETTIETLQSN